MGLISSHHGGDCIVGPKAEEKLEVNKAEAKLKLAGWPR
jgi:hypothetical protein